MFNTVEPEVKNWIEAINYEQKAAFLNAKEEAIPIQIKNVISTIKGVKIVVSILTKTLMPRFIRVGEYISIAKEKEDEKVIEGEIIIVKGKECVINSEQRIAETLINKIGEKVWLLPFSSVPYKFMRENVSNILTRVSAPLAEQILTKDVLTSNNICLIQGPPGTGKTTTIAKQCEKIWKERKKEYEKKKTMNKKESTEKKTCRVLLTAYTHKACVNIIEKLDELSVPFVCIDIRGITKRLQKYNLENMVRKAVIQATLKNPTVDWQKYKNFIRAQILQQNIFIISTAMAAPKRFKIRDDNPPFEMTIVDEGSQIPLPIIASVCALAKEVKTYGDARQLPPVVVAPVMMDTSNNAKINKLKKTLFDIVPPQKIILLDKQYRGRPEIFGLVSALFYGGRVKTGRYIEKRWEPVVEFIDTSLLQPQENNRINSTEAEICKVLLEELDERAKKQNEKITVGVISPFRNQAAYLASYLPTVLKAENIKLEIGTVHTMQGRTCDVVIVSIAATTPSPFLNPLRQEIIKIYELLPEIFKELINNNPEMLGYKIDYDNKIRAVYERWKKTLQQYKEELTLKEQPITIKLFDDKPELELELELQTSLPENAFATNLFNVALSRARYKLIFISHYDNLYRNVLIRLIYEWIKIFGSIQKPRELKEIRIRSNESEKLREEEKIGV